MSDITQILAKIESGDPQAAAQLLPLVYDELRRLAAAKLAWIPTRPRGLKISDEKGPKFRVFAKTAIVQ